MDTFFKLDRRGFMGLSGAGLLAGCATAETKSETLKTNSWGAKERLVESGEVTLKVYEMGEGPLVLLVHGWPELAYSWRYQMPALAAAGYKVVAPDMRGYGDSDNPFEVSAYTIQKLTQDLVNIIDFYGEDKASLVGHDWGAIVSWHAVLLHPTRFDSYFAMSVPYDGRSPIPPVDGMSVAMQDNFFYILYFQKDGVAEAEFDANPRAILSRLYLEPDSPRMPPELTDPKMAAGGWIPRLGKPTASPSWLSDADLDYYVSKFEASGFRGGINYYRNFNNNWKSTPQLEGATIDIPVKFLAGEQDVVIRGANAESLEKRMSATCNDFRGVILYPDTGHWVQQEEAERVNADLIAFLSEIER